MISCIQLSFQEYFRVSYMQVIRMWIHAWRKMYHERNSRNDICFLGFLHFKIFADDCVQGGWWRWALVSPDGVVPSRMVCV